MRSIHDLAAAAGIELPPASTPVGIYRPYVWDEEQLYVSGQVPMADGVLKYRDVADELPDLETYQNAARLCGLNLLAQVGAATEGRDCETIKCVKVTGFIAASRRFDLHPRVLNGASEVIGEVLGELGYHARSAVGVISLPNRALVEVEAIFRIRFAA